ncbi:MAG: AmmeMemoRadiSam system radical SAM enzyme [Deltaproteobacteria bacterium]|nr:MAG: AmmeMemoRadiSam system radical SAM enzyme [Deltaproteobacteria bacterium]
MHEAMFWEKAGDGRVRCGLCRFSCLIAPARRGRCGVRENVDGTLYALTYGKVVAEHVDPIEKKPLFHFHPGSRSYSLATVGCNFRCLHCQNFEISQWPHERDGIPGDDRPPQAIVDAARRSDCLSIAYTYTEPTIYFEYAYDAAVLARRNGVQNVFVTNGYTTTAALETIAPYLDAANVDLKAFSERFYREVTGATLAGVLDTLRDYRRLGIWLEVTTLVIPGWNDEPDELQQLAGFIARELGREVPWHVSAFYPTYRMLDRPRTPAATLERAAAIGREAGLQYVYVGNLPVPGGEDTRCPHCGAVVIRREGFRLQTLEVQDGSCRLCGGAVAGVGLG